MKCASVICIYTSEDDIQSQGELPEDSDRNEDQNKILSKSVASILSTFSELLITCLIYSYD